MQESDQSEYEAKTVTLTPAEPRQVFPVDLVSDRGATRGEVAVELGQVMQVKALVMRFGEPTKSQNTDGQRAQPEFSYRMAMAPLTQDKVSISMTSGYAEAVLAQARSRTVLCAEKFLAIPSTATPPYFPAPRGAVDKNCALAQE